MSGFDFIPDGKPVEEPEAGADTAYQKIPSTAGETLGEQAGSTLRSLGRATGRGFYQGSDIFSQMLAGAGQTETAPAAAAPFSDAPQAPAPGSLPSPMLPHDVYQERYAPLGDDGKPVSLGEGPLPEAVAKSIGEAKREEIERNNVAARFSNAHNWATNFAVDSLGFMLDPLRAATAFVPGIGEEAIMARLGSGLVARTLSRLSAGAASGALAMAPVTGLQYGLGREEASDYGLREALLDTAMGAGLNALVHAGVAGPIKDLVGWYKGKPPEPPPPPGGFAPAPQPPVAPPLSPEQTIPQPTIQEAATAPESPPSPFRTTVEINGVRTVIEADTVADFERQAAALRARGAAAAPEIAAETQAAGPAASTLTLDADAAMAVEQARLPPGWLIVKDQDENFNLIDPSGIVDTSGGHPHGFAEIAIEAEDEMRAAAAPIVNADAQTQHAAISSAVAELVDGRPVNVSPIFEGLPEPTPPPGAPPLTNHMAAYEANRARVARATQEEAEAIAAGRPTPAEVSAQQAAIIRDGFVPGVPPEELKQATADIYSPPEPEKVEAPKPAPAPAAGEAAAPALPRVTPQVPMPEGTKYVLPSFVTAPYRRPAVEGAAEAAPEAAEEGPDEK